MISYQVFALGIPLISASILGRVRVPSSESPSSLTLASNPIWSSDSTNASVRLSTPVPTYVCKGGYYGTGQHADSCDEALRSMAIVPGRPTQPFTWGQRDTGQYSIPLPQRWVSCQCSPGKCDDTSASLTESIAKRTGSVISRWNS